MRNLAPIGLVLLTLACCTAAADDADWRSQCYTPTQLVKAGDYYFLVDCWHHRVLWSKRFPIEFREWKTLDENLVEPHSVASDGVLFAVDETGCDRLCVYRPQGDGFQKVQRIERLGRRPHRTIHDARTDAFYVLSCASSDITKLVRRGDRLVVRYTKHLDFLEDAGCRSMTIVDDAMYFVAGPGAILKTTYRDDRYQVLGRYPIAAELNGLAGQNDLFRTDDGWWYMTTTPGPIARARSLEGLAKGEYENVSAQLGLRGTPYYLSQIDGRYYLPQITRHNGILSFVHRDGRIADVRTLYDFGPPRPCDVQRRATGAGLDAPLTMVPNPEAPLTPETSAQQKSRHAEVARARSGTILLLHRAAAEMAPENTLSAIRVAKQLGVQGVEMDIRRTLDGHLVLFHDDRLENRLDGFGTVEESYYEELLLYTPRDLPLPLSDDQRIPNLREVLQLIRDTRLLMLLDIKSPGIDARMLAELGDAGMLDHVVDCNDSNAPAFQPGKFQFHPLPCKGALIGNRVDFIPIEVEAMLRRPGQSLLLDDPRTALWVLGQPARRVEMPNNGDVPPASADAAPRRSWHAVSGATPEQLEALLRSSPERLPMRPVAVRLAIMAPHRFVRIAPELTRSPNKETRLAVAWNLGMIAKHRAILLDDPALAALAALLRDPEQTVRAEAAVACGRARISTVVPEVTQLLVDGLRGPREPASAREARLNALGHYAFALGLLGEKSPAVVAALLDTLRHRETCPNPMWLGVDGAMAVWALGELRVQEAVAPLRELLFSLPPPGWIEPEDEQALHWLVYWDLQASHFAPRALARIGTREALGALLAVLDIPDQEAARRSPDLLARTAEAVVAFPTDDPKALVKRLLPHGVPQIRGAAILKCLREPDPAYRSLLEPRFPWALPWWDAQHGTARPCSPQ